MTKFKSSPYQEDIFEFIKYGFGNAVVLAVAGSGKSTTIIKGLDYIKPDKKVLFAAFNSSIVEELKLKINRDKTDVKTIHSIGLSMIKYNFKDKNIEIYDNKYLDKLSSIIYSSGNEFANNKNYKKNILKLCNLGRFYLVDSVDGLVRLSNKYNVILLDDEINVALELIEWGKQSLIDSNLIDYTDMVFLPNVLNLKAFKYDFIIIDEAQDLSVSQISLLMKCFKQGTRFIAVGDEKQAIYGFSGSSIESFHKLKNISNTIELPLSVCYRCPKNIIKFVQKIVPDIQYSENASEGFINFHASINDLIDGDMVICRNTAPLVNLYIKLIENNITCYIKGVDIGINLLEIIDNVYSENITNILKELNESLTAYIIRNKKQLILTEDEIKNTQEYNDFNDKIECIKNLSKGLNNKKELIDKINNMFSDEKIKGICLSTIHKSKGLEADNVYILNNKLIPSKFAKQEWELIQERNLEYVAYTRSKNILGFINNE